MAKWYVLKKEDGTIISMGDDVPTPGKGEAVDTYDEPQEDIISTHKVQKWNVIKDEDGNPVRFGFSDMVAGDGETLEQYDTAQDDIIAEHKAAVIEAQESVDDQIAAYDAKVANETITHGELVKLLKLKKQI